MSQESHASWWSDLCHSLITLPVPVLLALECFPTVEVLANTLRQVELSLARHLFDGVMQSRKLPIIQARFRRLPLPVTLSAVCRPQPYLTVVHPKHREALIRLICSDNHLGVEEGRRRSPKVPRHLRICRFCRRQHAVEDEIHVLFECDAVALKDIREARLFATMERLAQPLPGVQEMFHRMAAWDFLDFLLRTERLLPALAHYVYEILELVDTVPPLLLGSDDELRSLCL